MLNKPFCRLFAGFVVSAMIFGLCSCGDKSENNINITLKDDFPVTVQNVKIEKRPEKVISLSPVVTELIYTMGNESQLIAVSSGTNYPGMSDNIANVGDVSSLDCDKIVSLGADLVITATSLSNDDKIVLENAKITLLTVNIPVEYAKIAGTINTLAAALSGKSTGAENAKSTVENQQKNLLAVKASNAVKSPKMLLCLSYDDKIFANKDSSGGAIITAVGAVNAMGNATSFGFSAKQIAAANPEFIFCSKGEIDKILADTALKNVTAVKTKQVYEIDIPSAERMGSRMVDVAKAIYNRINPTAVTTTAAITSK